MKSYEEIAENVLKRRNEYLAEKKNTAFRNYQKCILFYRNRSSCRIRFYDL